jgi:nucleoside-diphosphate-sugar epimerase
MNHKSDRNSILVSGANGFIGHYLCRALKLQGFHTTALSRRHSAELDLVCDVQINGIDLTRASDEDKLRELLKGVDVVVHLAATQPLPHRDKRDKLDYYWGMNVDGTLRLSNTSVKAGVSRFIFLSSIKVSGEESNLGAPFKIDDKPNPEDPYAVSKCIAEQTLGQVSTLSSMEMTIIRPPLVYSDNLGGSFRGIKKLLNLGLPLPFKKIKNKRSFISVDNLVDLIVLCISHPKASNEKFFASDGMDISTTELFNLVGNEIRKKTIFFPLPKKIGKFVLCNFGYPEIARRIYSSWQVDIGKTTELLGWVPKKNFNKR